VSSRIAELLVIAGELGTSVAQLATAWVLSRGRDIIPLIGARTRARLAEALGSLDLNLSADELARIERAVPIDQIRSTL
jgi:aryl-alcohol dehydrogenase-like predicted oxidoreductase